MMGVAEKMRLIALAARREDGTDTPLGEQCREAADAIERLTKDRDEARALNNEWAANASWGTGVPGMTPTKLRDTLVFLMLSRDRARAENERLREALAFYADPNVYKPHPHGPAFDDRDLSFVARAALTPSGTIPPAKPDQEAGAAPSGKTEDAT